MCMPFGKVFVPDLIFVYYVNACLLSDVVCMYNGTFVVCTYVCLKPRVRFIFDVCIINVSFI